MAWSLVNSVMVGMITGIALIAIFALSVYGGFNPLSSQARLDHCNPQSTAGMFGQSNPHEITNVQYRFDEQTKMGPAFRDRINCLIEYGETRPYWVIIIVADQDKDVLIKTLTERHGVTEYGRGQSLSFVTAKVPLKEIPKLADYDFVKLIGDGEQKIQPTDWRRIQRIRIL